MKADLHIHTNYSGDNGQRLEEIFREAERIGLGAVGIADHNTIEGAMKAMKMAPEGLIVVPAIEITSSDGHILAYNVERDVPRGRSVAETIDIIHSLGGIAVAAHPFRIWSGLGSKEVRRNKFDAVEVLNARNTDGGNRKSRKLARSLDLPITAGSDAHKPSDIGEAILLFLDDCQTVEDLIQAIMDKKVKAQGSGRSTKGTVSYGSKSIAKWLLRGMKRL